VSFDLPAGRSYQIETSTDLINWTPWNVEGGSGQTAEGETFTISGPAADEVRFFRISISAN
jgi:hypothetical protein